MRKWIAFLTFVTGSTRVWTRLWAGWLTAGLVVGTIASVPAAELAWQTDCRAAFKQARREGKLVLLEFTGSDWCPPCVKVKQEVLGSEVFRAFAPKQLVLVELDYPRRRVLAEHQRDHNAFYQRKYRVTGFPTLLLCDADGRELGRFIGFSSEMSGPALVARVKELGALNAAKTTRLEPTAQTRVAGAR